MPRRNNAKSSPRTLRRLCALCVNFFLFLSLAAGCGRRDANNPASLTFLIESNPTNLDPRFATDSQSQKIDGLLFSSLLERDDQMNFHGDLAEFWSTPDPLTYIFHMRPGVHFHDGRPLTAADVKYTFESILNTATHSPKRGAFRMIASIEAPDAATVIFHLTEPYASFLWNLARPAVGIVPQNAGADFSRHPIGSDPFRFASFRNRRMKKSLSSATQIIFAVPRKSLAFVFALSPTPSSALSNCAKAPPTLR
jgi:peptide/nickel transport system substrate-binding protein